MSIRARVCAWIATLGLVMPSATPAQERTDREVVDLIVRDGPQARAIRAQVEVTRREQLARLMYPNPAVTYSREGAGFTEFLQLGQSLPAFGARAALSRAGVAATAAAEADRDARLWMLRAEAATSAARLIAEQTRLEVARAYSQDIAGLIDVLATREREGEGSRFDRLRAEHELRDARQLVTSTTIAVAEAKASLEAMLPSDGTVTRVTGALYAAKPLVPMENLLARAKATRPELHALQRSGDRAAFESEAARRARRPTPTLFGGLKRAGDESGRENGGVFGLSLSLPLFDAGGREAERWQAERARFDAERASLERQVRSETVRASEALALRHTAVSQDEEAAGAELTRIAEVAYRDGEVGILELLDAFRTASRANLRSIDIRLDARLAQIAVERAVGDVLWP